MSTANFDLQSSNVQLLPDTENKDSSGNPINYYAEYDYNKDSSTNFKYEQVIEENPRTKLVFEGFALGVDSSYMSIHSPNFTIDSEKIELPGVEYSLYKFPIRVLVPYDKFPEDLRVTIDGTKDSNYITEALKRTENLVFFDSGIANLSAKVFQLAHSSDPLDTNIYLSNKSEGIWDVTLTSYWKAEAVGPKGPGPLGVLESDPKTEITEGLIVDLNNNGEPITESFISRITISF